MRNEVLLKTHYHLSDVSKEFLLYALSMYSTICGCATRDVLVLRSKTMISLLCENEFRILASRLRVERMYFHQSVYNVYVKRCCQTQAIVFKLEC
jgi:hypothetical protein